MRILGGVLAAIVMAGSGSAGAQCGRPAASGQLVATRVLQTQFCTAFAYSSRASMLATGDCGEDVGQVFSTRTGQPLARLRHGYVTRDLVFSPSGTLLFSRETGRESHDIHTPDEIALHLWNPATGEQRATLTAPIAAAHAGGIEFSPDEHVLVAALHMEIDVFDTNLAGASFGAYKYSSRAREDGWAGPLAFSADGGLLAYSFGRLVSNPPVINVHDMAANRRLVTLTHPMTVPRINDLAFSPDGSRLVSAIEDGAVHFWDIERGSASLGREVAAWRGPNPAATQVAFSVDGAFLAAVFQSDYTVHDGITRIWNAQTGQVVCDVASPTFAFANNAVALIVDGNVQIWSLPNLDQIVSFPVVDNSASIRISEDGATLVVTGSNRTHSHGSIGQVQVWAMRSAQ